ncbi:MAG: radical SAM protein [Acidimicrobiales bacterium]
MRWRIEADEPQQVLFADESLVDRHVGSGEFRGMEFLHVNARTVVNRVAGASRMPFEWTINAYRGCSHACSYCFARPTHAYLELGIGDDFDRKIVVKVNAVERVRAELSRPAWGGHHVAMGTNTDPYQRCEGKYHLYRGILGVLAERANPFSLLTKSTLVLRDLDLLRAAAAVTDVRVNLSIATLDEAVWRATEPGTPHPRQRVAAVRRLNEAGVPCGVLVAPIIPGLSDAEDQLDAVVQAVVAAGAVGVSTVALHLKPGTREVFLERLAHTHPEEAAALAARYATGAYLPKPDQQDLAAKVRRLVSHHRGRSTSSARARFVEGPKRQGLGPGRPPPHPQPPPNPSPQLTLFS